jgi:hypothetical protein
LDLLEEIGDVESATLKVMLAFTVSPQAFRRITPCLPWRAIDGKAT